MTGTRTRLSAPGTRQRHPWRRGARARLQGTQTRAGGCRQPTRLSAAGTRQRRTRRRGARARPMRDADRGRGRRMTRDAGRGRQPTQLSAPAPLQQPAGCAAWARRARARAQAARAAPPGSPGARTGRTSWRACPPAQRPPGPPPQAPPYTRAAAPSGSPARAGRPAALAPARWRPPLSTRGMRGAGATPVSDLSRQLHFKVYPRAVAPRGYSGRSKPGRQALG